MGDLKILAVEARNHLYAILRDTEVWQQEALGGRCPCIVNVDRSDPSPAAWKQSKVAKKCSGANKDRAVLEKEGNPIDFPKSPHVTNLAS